MKTKILFAVFMLVSITHLFAQPTISSFSPASGPIGTTVTINGTNFSTTTSNNIVYFGATRASVNSATSTSLNVTVPVGATYQYITVQVSGLTAFSAKPFVVTFASGGGYNFGSGSFASRVFFATGNYPVFVAAGDLDGDGKTDLVVANNYAATISVLRNTSSGTTVSFATKIDYTSGNYPEGIAIGDLNGDGKPDLIVANNSSSTISVYRNLSTSGTISFAAKVDYACGLSPKRVVTGDFDLDGKPDVAVSGYGSGQVTVFRNTSAAGVISFATRIDFVVSDAWGMAIGDLDADGRPDLAVTDRYNQNVAMLRDTTTTGAISFDGSGWSFTGSQPEAVAIGDLDADGKPDLVVANAVNNTSSGSISVLRNNSSTGYISTAAKVDFTTAASPKSVAMGDLDGDGKPDLAVINYDSFTLSLFKNTCTSGSISFAPRVIFPTGTGSNYPNCVAICDIDGDGKPDLVFTTEYTNTVSVLRNTGIFLPVKLISFNTELENDLVKLTWQTASEENSDYFEIERSDDRNNWLEAGLVKGNGTSNSITNYLFYDHVSVSGDRPNTLYYRLKQVDFDGKSSFSDIRVVNLVEEKNEWIVYPNPATNEITISTNTSINSKDVLMEVYDLQGKKVMSERRNLNSTKLDIKNLAAGMYFLMINDYPFKFVKLKQ